MQTFEADLIVWGDFHDLGRVPLSGQCCGRVWSCRAAQPPWHMCVAWKADITSTQPDVYYHEKISQKGADDTMWP